MRILIVDQECGTRKRMEELLTAGNRHQIVGEADNGLDGLALIKGEQPDLVITEIDLPKLNGLEMIHQVKGKGGRQIFVIVSGKDEFVYTRKAICYGVEDYLLKPVSGKEIEEMLTRMEGRLAVEKENYELIREGVIKGMLTGERELKEENRKRFLEVCGFKGTEGYTLLALIVPQTQTRTVENLLQKIHTVQKEYSFHYVYLEAEGAYYCVFEGKEISGFLQRLHRMDYEGVLRGEEAVLAVEYIADIEEFSKAYEHLKTYYEYQLVFKAGCLLTKENISSYKGKEYVYPKAVENSMLKALVQLDHTRTMAYGKQFVGAINAQHIYPWEVRHAYIKSLTAIWTVMQELSPEFYERLERDDAMQKTITAITKSQLETIFYHTLEQCLKRESQNEWIENSVILRAIAVVREHYTEGITLNEVAEQLGITPEYLSFLFTKEVGDTFSNFLKKFRISHAKRLLKFSNKKVYEISADLGYLDSKYFSRVFKQEVGITPAEYRQLEAL